MQPPATQQAVFQFHGDLNFFLHYKRRDRAFMHQFDHVASIKDMIESLGVPHPEVNEIVVNDAGVDFDYLVRDGDQVAVYPVGISSDIDVRKPLCPSPPNELRFVLDAHLGKLAAYLRMLGFDTRYDNAFEDDELAEISAREARILLTRDLGVLKRGIVAHGYYVRSTKPRQQLIELLERYRLPERAHPFQRCLSCNGRLGRVEKSQIGERLRPRTHHYYDEFYVCEACDKLYWKGSHYDKMRRFIQDALGFDVDDAG